MDADFFKRNKKQITKIIVITIIILLLYRLISNLPATMATIGRFFSTLKPFMYASILAYLLYFPCNYLEKKVFKRLKSRTLSRMLSIGIVYLLFIAFLIVLLSFLVPIILNSVTELFNSLPDYIESFKKLFYNIPENSFFSNINLDLILERMEKFTSENLEGEITKYLNSEQFFAYTSQIVDFLKSIVQLILTFIVSIYMLFERENISIYFKRFLEARTQKKTYLKTLDIIQKANDIFRKYIVSQFTDAFIVSIIMTAALLVLKVEYAVLLGFLIGLFNLIPFFGALTAGIVATLLTVITGGPELALQTGIVIVVLQQIDANIIQPKIVGKHLQVSRILVISGTVLGGAYFGFWGMFFGVPVFTTIKAIVDNTTKNRIKQNKIRRLINKRLLVKIRKPDKHTIKRFKIKKRIEA